ncbi:MAG TPA: bifunctional isocitrate dehydrogenase kinase/phosphatase [Steroidobacteraceae bacterium]|nr:bifunctional isocitrate dehydrogenase kinase/phosphatase [Steroidobacteraceae bacterium]
MNVVALKQGQSSRPAEPAPDRAADPPPSCTPQAAAELIAARFRAYNDEFGVITRRAAGHFLSGDAAARERDAVARIELYEQHVGRTLEALRAAGAGSVAGFWEAATAAYGRLIEREPDSDFYRTFYNSVTRDVFGTVGVNPAVEFCATHSGRASGSVPIRVYPAADSLLAAIGDVLADLPFRAALAAPEAAARRIGAELGRYFETRPPSAAPESIELIEPLFYRAGEALLVGRLVGDSAVTPLVIIFRHGADGVRVHSVLLSRNEISAQFGYANSYFHVDLPVVGAAVTLLRSFMPRKPVDELYTVLGRAKQGKTERYFALRRHLDQSIDTFVHAPGERGLVMIVFTLPSHDLVFKVIRDRFGAPKHTTRAEVMERYRFVFRHDRAGRMVDAQEFRRLRLPRSRFMPELASELLAEAGQSCRIEGEDLIIEHCYIERRLRPLNLYLRDAEPAAAEAAIIDYGNALRDLASTDIFAGDLLLKNFGVTRHGRVIFYDYDEVSLLRECEFRDLPAARCDEEESSAEPWFYVGPRDVFPEQWLPFLAMPPALREVFLAHHGELLTAPWWRARQAEVARQADGARPAH